MLKRNSILKCLIILTILLSFTQFSFAVDTSVSSLLVSDKYQNDVSVSILKTLFGGLPLFGGEKDALQNVFRIFNFCVLVVGGVLASYTIILGMTGTAQTGQFLGKYSSSMTPIRTAVGIALIIPVANGYALIQVLVMWLILQGIMLSNIVWGTFVSADTLADSLSVAPVHPEATILSKNVLIAATCMAAMQRQADIDGDDVQMGWSYGYGDSKQPLKKDLLAELVAKDPEKNITLNAGNLKGSNGIADNACGTITIKGFALGKDGLLDGVNGNLMAGEVLNGGTGALYGSNSENIGAKITGYGTTMYSAFRLAVDYTSDKREWNRWVNEMAKEHANATENLLSKSTDIANAIITNIDNKNAETNREAWSKEIQYADGTVAQNNEGLNPAGGEGLKFENPPVPAGIITQTQSATMSKEQIVKAIDSLAVDYQQYFRSKAARSYKDGLMYDTLVENANKYGWMLAGSFFTQMGGMTDAVNQIALEVPVASYTPYSTETTKNKYLNSRYLSSLNEYFGDSSTYGKDDSFRISSIDRGSNQNQSSLEKFYDSGFNLSVLIDTMLNNSINGAISDQEHPIMQLKRLGSIMLTLATTIITVMMTTMGKVDSASLFFLSMFGYTLVAVLITGGITMSYVLPMLPVLIWLGMCFGWLVMVIQAMIASPLWIVMHLTPHQGDDFIGQQRNGYQLVFTLVIRPILMTLGFIAAVLAITVVGFFINNLFIFIYSMSQVGKNGFATAMFSVIVVPFMYATIVYIALKEMLNIMHKVPDELLNWFGGNGGQLGGYAREMSGGSVQAFAGVNAYIGRPFEGMKHNLAERASYLQQKQNGINDIAERKKNDASRRNELEKSLIGGADGVSSYGGSVNESGTGYINGGYGGVSVEDVNSWGDMIDSGVLQNNQADIQRAKSSLYKNVPDNHMSEAMNQTMKEVKTEFKEKSARGDNSPISNTDFVRRVNQRLSDNLFGDNSRGMNHMATIAESRTGSSVKANDLMKNTFKKIDAISSRTGQDYETVAKDVSANIVGSMKGYSEANQTEFGSITPSSINKYGDAEQQHNYKLAGSMVNAWNKAVERDGRTEDKDILEFEKGKGFGFSNNNYTQKYNDGSWNNQSMN